MVAAAVALLCALVVLFAFGGRAGAHEGHAGGGFQVSTVFGDLVEPTSVEFADDGRVFVAEKRGTIKVFDGLDDAEPSIFADLTRNVHSYSDRGLIGMALHPNFPEDPRVYVTYTYDAPIGVRAPVYNDCENADDRVNNACIVSGNLSVLTARSDKSQGLAMVGEERVLINEWCQKFPGHSIGDVGFGADGALYVSGGDGADASSADYGQFDEGACGDPENEGGALRSQDLRTEGDPVGLSGTLIRVSPDTGEALPDNPRFTAPDDNESRIVAYGFRTPFRLAVTPGANDVWVGNVGWFRWEEIERVPESRKNGSGFGEVPNYGWPCYEGAFREPGYEAAGVPICEELYEEDPQTVVKPHIAWRHCDPAFASQQCTSNNVSSSVSGVEFYEGEAYPDEYHGALFFADGPRGKVWMAPEGLDGLPRPENVQTVLDDTKGYVVDLENGPGGEMYMVHVYSEGFGPGRIAKITQGPVARVEADKTFGPSPLSVKFDATSSTDPSGETLSYAWDLDGDGDFDDSTEAAPSFTYTGSENTVVRVKVTNSAGREATDSVTIYPNNTPPTANVNFVGVFERDESGNVVNTRPAEGWRVGDEIAFNGYGLDEEDELEETPYGTTLPTDAVRWDASIYHCYSANDCHRHPINGFGIGAGGGGIISAPDHGFPSYVELIMTVTDSRGLESQKTVRLDPRTVNLTFDSDPAGVPLTVGAKSEVGPFTREVIVGSTNTVSAPRTAEIAGGTRNFESWSDGGNRSHEIVAPEEDARYVARYGNVAPPETTINEKTPDLTNSRSARFTFTSSKAGSTFECALDGAEFEPCEPPKEYMNLSDGSHTFAVRAVDGAGVKDATPAEHSWVLDATAPNTTITSGPSGTVSSTSATFAFSSSESGSTFECRLDGGAFAACSSPRTIENLSRGKHTFEVRAVDRAGNTDASPATRSWTVKTTKPRVAAISPGHGRTLSSRTPLVRASVQDPQERIPKRNVRVFVNGNPRPFAYDPSNGRVVVKRVKMPPRWHVVRVVATDQAGNTASRTWRFRITAR